MLDHRLGMPHHPALRALEGRRTYNVRPPLSEAEKYRRAVAWFNGWRAERAGMLALADGQQIKSEPPSDADMVEQLLGSVTTIAADGSVIAFSRCLTYSEICFVFGKNRGRLVDAYRERINGAAQAPRSESVRTPSGDGCTTPEAAPPFTKPARVWRKTSEKMPPKGDYLARMDGKSNPTTRHWNGSVWSFGWDKPAHREAFAGLKNDLFDFEWLDESPSPQADAEGWIEHKGNVRPVPAGVRVQMRWSSGGVTEATMASEPGNGWSSERLRITHYRVVPQ